MPSLFLSRISPQEREKLIGTLMNTQSGNCFICGGQIDLTLHSTSIDIDHIEPISNGGKDGPENFAVTHESCNRSKQASDLRVRHLPSESTGTRILNQVSNRLTTSIDIDHIEPSAMAEKMDQLRRNPRIMQ